MPPNKPRCSDVTSVASGALMLHLWHQQTDCYQETCSATMQDQGTSGCSTSATFH